MPTDPDIAKILTGDFSWTRVRRYEMDPNVSWEDRYAQLEQHHVRETQALIRKLVDLAKLVQSGKDV